jgi:aminoglycoside 3-N-acetyltransferase
MERGVVVEADVVARTDQPATVRGMTGRLAALGVVPATTLLVHSSLSSLGWVAGGAQAVVQALLKAVGRNGTLVMPTHSANLTDPARWNNPPVPESWWPAIAEEMPAFDPARTPTYCMGAIPECFRSWPSVMRSAHPTVSFAALGPNARAVTAGHTLENGLGDGSPVARLYELDASVLLLGVGHDSNTSLHLAEYRSNYPGKQTMTQHSPVMVNGVRTWLTYQEVDGDTDDFTRIGADFAEHGGETRGAVGMATAVLLRQRDIVDYAIVWMRRNRGQPA